MEHQNKDSSEGRVAQNSSAVSEVISRCPFTGAVSVATKDSSVEFQGPQFRPAVSKSRVAPGPKGHFYVGNLPERRKDPLGLFMKVSRTYGPIARMKFGPKQIFLVSSPEFVKHVLVDNHKSYHKGFGYDKLHPVLGHGLLTSEGEFWRRQRKLAQPAFHRPRLASLAHYITESTQAMLDQWTKYAMTGEAFDVHREMNHLTLKIVSRMILGTDISTDEADHVKLALTSLLELANNRILSLFPLPLAVPTPGNLRSRQNIKDLNNVVYRIIKEHRESRREDSDLLTMLMDSKDDETGSSMNDEQLRDEVMTMFLAGHETTANLLSWTVYYLSKHPAVEKKLHEELQIVLGDRRPTFEDLTQLKYTAMVLEEALRLSPPAWVFSRECIREDEIGGYGIPKGGIVVMSPYVTHRSPEYWDNPEGFDPERFIPEQVAARPKFAYFPFSGGPRQCIGNHFAMMESQLALAMMAQRYRLQLVPGHVVEPEPLITLRPRHGVQMVLKPRH